MTHPDRPFVPVCPGRKSPAKTASANAPSARSSTSTLPPQIDDGHDLGLQVVRYRPLYNTVRPHQTALLADYQRMLSAAVVRLHQKWQEKEGKAKMEDGE